MLLYSVLVKFYFLNFVLFANFCKSCICLSQISLFQLCKKSLKFAFKLNCQDLGLLATSTKFQTEDAT